MDIKNHFSCNADLSYLYLCLSVCLSVSKNTPTKKSSKPQNNNNNNGIRPQGLKTLVNKLLEEVDTRRASDCERLQRQTHTRAGGGRHGARATQRDRERERLCVHTGMYTRMYLMNVYINTRMYK